MDVGLSSIFRSFRIWSIEICWLFRSGYVRCEQSELCQWKNEVISTINSHRKRSCSSYRYFLVSSYLHDRFHSCVFAKNRLLRTMQIGRKNHDIPMPIIQLFFALSLLVNFGLVLVDRILFHSKNLFIMNIFILNSFSYRYSFSVQWISIRNSLTIN